MQQHDRRNMPVEGAVADILVAAAACTVASSSAAACTVCFAASLSSALVVVAVVVVAGGGGTGMDKVHIHPVLDTEIEEMAVQSQLP